MHLPTDVCDSVHDYDSSPEGQSLQQLRNIDVAMYGHEDLMNYENVVRDYERGEITAPPAGSVYFYYRGHRVTDQVIYGTFGVTAHWGKWAEEHGEGGRAWMEGGKHPVLRTPALQSS
jgi:hypothetical protein